jgi:UDP-N-acetylmuramoylalanine--D-glutamate ligase
VWGTGQTGLMTAREMLHRGHEVRLVDENAPDIPFDMQVKLLDRDDITWADLVIPSPGIPRDHHMFSYATKVLSEIEVASWFLKGKLIAVTGTNGKTTTATLISEILKKAGHDTGLGGNISPPLISLVDKDPDYIVAEISSFQLEWIEHFRAHISICMNITPDHLDRYKNMEEYVRYKLKIFENQEAGDFAIVNDDDPYLKNIETKAKRVGFSLSRPLTSDGAYVENSRVVFTGSIHGDGPRLPGKNTFGIGVMEDMLAAALAARLLGIANDVMEDVFHTFCVIHHRFEQIATVNGISFFDDSKATNVGSVEKALSGLQEKVVLILGGKDKGGDFSHMASQYKTKIKKAVIIGEATQRIMTEISDYVDCVTASDMKEAVFLAYAAAVPGDIVLLSPGCASFDMYESYAHRGEIFQQCVKAIR